MNTSRPPNTPRTGGSPLVACLACRRPNRGNQEQTSGFTLMEMLLALAVSAIVLAGIGGVFFSAMRLRERTTAMLDEAAPLQQALTILRRDLKGALPPGTGMAGEFRCGNVSSSIGETLGLQFSTTTGVLRDDMPWGDVQEVTYELRTSAVRNGGSGRVLIRTVTRDLLATAGLDYTEQWLLENVESLAFECFDGLQWRELWDTNLGDTNLPTAVRVRLQLAADEHVDTRNRQPYELVVPLVTQARVSQETLTGGEE